MTLKPLPTPTNLIMGFLGVGKTTAILSLLQQKPADQCWAVLVNEFGQIGIDGAIYASQNAVVRELPGGCLCCAQGVPFQVTVNRMLAEIKPDRLIIEPTGLGHPKKLLDQLTSGYFQSVLDVKASICLLDPRKLNDPRYMRNEVFLDQIALSDVLVANKTDLADFDSISLFHQWVKNSKPQKSLSAQTQQGRLSSEWLDLPRYSPKSATFTETQGSEEQPKNVGRLNQWQTSGQTMAGQDYRSEGKVFPADSCFDYQRLYDVLSRHQLVRAKAVVATNQGWFVFNAVDGSLACLKIRPGQDSRIEFLDIDNHASFLWTEIDHCLL